MVVRERRARALQPGPVARHLRARREPRLSAPREARLADFTGRRILGLTASVGAGGDLIRTRALAAAFAEDGFDGIRHRLRHDPRQRLASVALFGATGGAAWPVGEKTALPEELIDAGRPPPSPPLPPTRAGGHPTFPPSTAPLIRGREEVDP